MACYNISINNKNYQLTNNESEPDFDYESGHSIVINFLSSGILPDGYQFIDLDTDSIITNPVRLLEIHDDLQYNLSHSDNNSIVLNAIRANDQNILINKLIGNRSNTIITPEEQIDYNILVNKSWGISKTWYGFNESRYVIITGDDNIGKRRIASILVNNYNAIKQNDTRIIDNINSLYNRLVPEEKHIDPNKIYDRFTYLANSYTKDLINILRLPNSRIIPSKGKSISSLLIEDINQAKGAYFNYKGDTYIITNKKNQTTILANKIEINNDHYKIVEDSTEIPLKHIKYLYSPIIVKHNNSIYKCIKNIWFYRNNEVTSKLANELNNSYYDLTDDNGMIYNFFGENITAETIINNKSLIDQLSDDAIIYTNTGIYQKQNGVYTNGEQELNPTETITNIRSINSNDDIFLKQIKDLDPKPEKTNINDLKILLYDKLNIRDFSDIEFKSKDKLESVVVHEGINLDGERRIMITLNSNMDKTNDNYRTIQLALAFKNYLLTTPNIPIIVTNNINETFRELKKNIINKELTPLSEELQVIKEVLLSKIDEESNIEDNNRFDEAIKMNNEINDKNEDFFEELVQKGFIIVGCEL